VIDLLSVLGNILGGLLETDQSDSNNEPDPLENEGPSSIAVNVEGDCMTLNVTFDASESQDPYGYIVSYIWDFGEPSSGIRNTENTSNPITSHTYAKAGEYTFKLTVTDDQGATKDATSTVTIEDCRPPPANFTFSRKNCYEIEFDARTDSDPDETAFSYSWDFGDSTEEEEDQGAVVTHKFDDFGNFTVTLTVTGSNEVSAESTQIVRVECPLEVTLRWNVTANVDLLVKLPNGIVIGPMNRGPDKSTGFGALDHDDMTGERPEIVFWTFENGPPSGEYVICARFNSPVTPTDSDPFQLDFTVVEYLDGSLLPSGGSRTITSFGDSLCAKDNSVSLASFAT